MTVASTTSKVSYTGNGVTTVFSVPFSFFETTNLSVIERVLATGVETTLTETTDYTVTGGDGATGSITAVVAPASTKRWTIKRVLPRTQGLDLTPNDPFPANEVEQTLDRLVMLVQELEETLNRSLKYPTTDDTALIVDLPSSVDRASKYLAFGSDGSLTLTAGTTSDIVASTFGESLVAALDAAAARIVLGLVIGTDVQAYDADTLKADTADNLTAGFTATSYNAGTKTTGTFTPDAANGNMQHAVNGGAHTLAPPAGSTSIVLQYTNNASAGTVTTSGFTKVTGSTISTTNGDDFLFFITVANGFSHLHVQALQ